MPANLSSENIQAKRFGFLLGDDGRYEDPNEMFDAFARDYTDYQKIR